MNILVCNDDGINSEGLLALANVLNKKHNISIYVPDGNRSGFSRSLSFYKDIVVKKVNYYEFSNVYTVSGTPADCVKIATSFSSVPYDLVISGINLGSNLGNDILYSGTVNACFEANTLGIPAIAISNVANKDFNFQGIIEFLENNIEKIISLSSKEYTLNINMPNAFYKDIKGVKFCMPGLCRYSDGYVETDKDTFKLVGKMLPPSKDEEFTDVYYAFNNYITISPVVHTVKSEFYYNKLKDFKF